MNEQDKCWQMLEELQEVMNLESIEDAAREVFWDGGDTYPQDLFDYCIEFLARYDNDGEADSQN